MRKSGSQGPHCIGQTGWADAYGLWGCMSGIVGSRRYGAAALLLAVAGGLIYYFLGPGGVSDTAPRATGYDAVEGYGTACELFYPLAVRDDFTAVLPGWAGTDRGKVSDDAGRLRMKPAAGES